MLLVGRSKWFFEQEEEEEEVAVVSGERFVSLLSS
jgi:hypothetical protein